MTEPYEDEVFGRINRLLHVAKDEDERGMVLKSAAFAEECLRRLLIAYLRDGKAAAGLVEGFNAPLGTFSARIKACYAVGLISNKQFKDLEIVRKVRNEFAHNWEGCSFESQSINDLIASLSDSRIDMTKYKDLKRKFYSSVTCTLVELEYLLSTVGSGKRRVPIVAKHLSTEPYKE